jgi:hypothetical protein
MESFSACDRFPIVISCLSCLLQVYDSWVGTVVEDFSADNSVYNDIVERRLLRGLSTREMNTVFVERSSDSRFIFFR